MCGDSTGSGGGSGGSGGMIDAENKGDFNTAMNNEFSLAVFDNGHEHTLTAYGEKNMWTGSDKSGSENQWDYIKYVEQNENTSLSHYLTASNEKTAKDKEIIDEDGGW